ncbi:MAG: hypothetical protein ACKOEO_18650, partial [Planctomycetaceae bacterium]
MWHDILKISGATLLIALSGCEARVPENPAVDAGETVKGTALPRVQAAKPQRKALVQKTEQPGVVEAWQKADIHPRSSGVVERVLVDIGDMVRGPVRAAVEGAAAGPEAAP